MTDDLTEYRRGFMAAFKHLAESFDMAARYKFASMTRLTKELTESIDRAATERRIKTDLVPKAMESIHWLATAAADDIRQADSTRGMMQEFERRWSPGNLKECADSIAIGNAMDQAPKDKTIEAVDQRGLDDLRDGGRSIIEVQWREPKGSDLGAWVRAGYHDEKKGQPFEPVLWWPRDESSGE